MNTSRPASPECHLVPYLASEEWVWDLTETWGAGTGGVGGMMQEKTVATQPVLMLYLWGDTRNAIHRPDEQRD